MGKGLFFSLAKTAIRIDGAVCRTVGLPGKKGGPKTHGLVPEGK